MQNCSDWPTLTQMQMGCKPTLSVLFSVNTPLNDNYIERLLPFNETDTDTDKMCAAPNGNLHRSVSLSNMRTSTQFYASYNISLYFRVINTL